MDIYIKTKREALIVGDFKMLWAIKQIETSLLANKYLSFC